MWPFNRRQHADVGIKNLDPLPGSQEAYSRAWALQPQDLIYAAYARCPCGAGMAYIKDRGKRERITGDCWDCSAIILGEAKDDVKHEAQLPFTFYEVKSENQPSANGATTRPK